MAVGSASNGTSSVLQKPLVRPRMAGLRRKMAPWSIRDIDGDVVLLLRRGQAATATAVPDRPRTQSRARPLSREEKQRRYLSLLHEAKAPHASPVRGAALRAMDVGLGSDADDSGNEAGHGDLPTTRDDLIAAPL